jgi:prolyl-tRNA synthetase
MDLIGVPHRIVLSERGLTAQQFEYKGRSDDSAEEISLDKLTSFLDELCSKVCATG